MPEEKSKKTVDIDTSGPGAEVDVAEEKVKEEGVVETETKEPEIKVEETKEEEEDLDFNHPDIIIEEAHNF